MGQLNQQKNMKGYNLIDTGQSINHTHFTNKLHLIYLYLYYMASLPQPLAAKIKSIPMDPLALANNVQLAYMLSFSNYALSNDSVQCSPKDSYNSPLECYNFVDFDDTTYQTLYAETKKNYEIKNSTVVKCIRNSFKDFFTRVSAMTYSAALKKDELLSAPSTSTLKIPTFEAQYKIDQMRGNNPNEWPRNLKQFHEQISKLPWNAFSCEPEIYFDDFFKNAFVALKNCLKKLSATESRTEVVRDINLIIQVIIMISFKTNNQTYILAQLENLRNLQVDKVLSQAQNYELISKLQTNCLDTFQKVPVNQQQQYHAPKKLWEKGSAFMIMKKIHFQKQNGLAYFTITNDGTYLYIYISSINGGMYKVGTGKNSSIAGKIYLEKQILLPVGSKLDQVNWVYCKGKLYLKSGSREPNSIEVINSDNFKTQQVIELKCPSIFGHQSLVNLNRNSILLTDGQRLYYLGKQLKIKQNKDDKKQQQVKVVAEQQGNKKKKSKKQKAQQNPPQAQKSNPQQIDKVIQFVLFQFQFDEKEKEIECDEALAEELYLSFNNYFTKKECRRALDLCENDLSDAAQWLCEQGEKQRTTKTLYPTSKTIIAQSQITSNFAEKNLKGSNEIITKEGSILHTQNVHESVWTMDEEEITCYSEGGFKIFSKSAADTRPINQNSGLVTTHLKTLEGKIQRNPDYTISYDPYNRIFYTFTWPTDGGHYFPTAVLIGSDYKQALQLNYQKKISLSHFDPKDVLQFSKWMLIRMNLLDNTHCPEHGRVNNWLWYFGQKIIQLNREINGNNDLDKKKLTNKRSKLLNKMNRVNDYFQIYHKNKQVFEKEGKITQQIRLIPPFGSDGTCENLLKIRNIFGKELNVEQVNDFIICLQGWLSSRPKILDAKTRQALYRTRQELLHLKPKMNQTSIKKLNNLFIQNFFEFFDSPNQQLDFITTLDQTQVSSFVEKHHFCRYRTKKSIVYELKSKQCLIQKYESKTKFEEIFLSTSNVSLKDLYESFTIGNLMTQSGSPDQKKDKASLHKFLQKQIINGINGVKLFEFIFLEAFRSIVKRKIFEEYSKQLEKLFLETFKIIESVIPQANIALLKRILDPFNQILQIYFASLSSFTPCVSLTESLLKILDEIQKKEIVQLFSCIEDLQFEGISQTFQKIYETPHPIERGKNQNFPPLKNTEASLIYAQFDKRCQSDPNHDNLSIQMTHENSPVGNSINCNDGVFTTNLRLTGKVDSGKPYLIMGNSVNVDFSSSGHAKDAKSFGRFGFKFGLRPIFAGKIKYKKQGLDKVEKVFGTRSEFEKLLNTLKLLTITISNSIQNLVNFEKEDKQNHEVHRFLNGKIFKQGYEEQQSIVKTQNEANQFNLEHLFGEKSKFRQDSRVLLMKILHAESLKKDSKNQAKQEILPAIKSDQKQIWDLDGIPGYIKSYVEKIKAFNGDFIDVFLETRNLALPKGIYATEMKKAGFTEEMKKLWLQGQAILFLTVLKHSGLLHLNIKFSIEYIKANLKAFQEARNGIYESFIRRMQSVREWRDLLQTFEGKRDQIVEQQQKSEKISQSPKVVEKISGIQIKKKGMATKTIKLENKGKNQQKVEKKSSKKEQQDLNALAEKRRKQAQRMIRQRLTQDYMIKSICFIKGIEFVSKQTYENVSRIIAKLQQQSKSNKKQTESVYIEPMQHLIKSCIFLLKLKSPSTKQIICEEQNIEPEEMFRSYSQDQRHVNLNKVNIFREWLENWKKWKDFKKQGKVELKFPVSEIIDFVNSWIPLHRFKSQIHLRIKTAQNRTKFYELNNSLVRSTANSFLSKYAIGAEVASIKGSYNTGLQSVSTNKMNQLFQKYREYSSSLKVEEQKKFKQLPLKLRQIQSLIKSQSDNALQKIKLTSLHLYLIQSQNPNIDIDVALFFIPLKYLTSANQQLIFIVSLIVQRAYLSNHSLEDIIDRLYKEIGNNSISCKRWRDLFFIERMLFLLRKLEHKCRQKLEVPEKQKAAEVLFYLIYHLQIPLICRISFRILSLLKITLKRDINTPFEKTYKAITLGQNLSIQEFKLENKNSYNNLQLIAAKCFEVFKGQFQNQIRQKMLSPFKEISAEQSQKQNSYTIILNMNQEEDIVWMISVLYYLEQVEKTITPIKDWEEYLSKKNKKKQHHKDKDNQNSNKQGSNQEIQVNQKKTNKKVLDQRILLDIPNETFCINDQIQANLPVGWFFNYCNIFNDYLTKNAGPTTLNIQNAPNLAQKKGKNANQPANPTTSRKQWNPVEFLKFYKKFEDLTSKPLQEPKQDEPEENKIQFIKAKNFISRIRKHTGEVSTIFSNLSQNGYYVFRQDVPKDKCQIICQLFTLGGQNRLKPIPCDFKTKDYATKLSPAYVTSAKKSQLKLTCIKSDQYKRFNDIINAPTGIQTKVQNNPLLYYTALSGSEFLLQDKCHLPYEEFPEMDSNEDDIKIQFSKYFTESGFSRMKKRQDQVYLKQYPKLRYFISQGGLESGLQECTLVPAFDSSLTCQKSKYDHIYPSVPKHEILQDSEELLEKIIKLMKGQFCQIKEKDHIIPYVLLSCYLQKLTSVNLEFVSVDLLKQFQEGLSKFIRGFKADSSIEKYRQKIQVLTTKMLDSENKNLSQFRLYRYDEDMINQDLINFIDLDKIKSTLKAEKAQSTHETIDSHQYPKSNYLLPVHTPIPEENKLLKYWQKNILPKIYDFVKSSLKQIEIDDFFEQMRIPLRKNDQLEAKKIAYVICDNKLPAGAVLPDSNHNWNSLTIEDVTVGQDVLLRLSRSKHQSFSPLMCSQSQQHRVGQVMFIDQKNFSALVRHRLPQYAIFVYSWVPINSLQSVEESLAHYSMQTIYKQLESSLKGIIYNYSKICMTSLSKKVKINMQSLLQQTIVDIFRDNPISGWNQNKNWPLKQAFKSQLAQGNTHVVSFVENKFAPFKSYDIDLFSESILNLNKFEDSLGLIVSFKKTASLIWYSGIRFYSDEYGYKQIANTYASKSCVNELQPLEFKNPNVYCKYYTNKQFLKAFDQGKYEQKQIGATIFAVDPSWTVSTYICNVVGEIAIEQNKYEDYLCRFNKVFLKWLQKRQAIYLSNQLCRVITKNTLRIRRILTNKQKAITLQAMGTSEQQIKSFIEWVNILKEAEDKDVLVLYSPLLQDLIQAIASLLSGCEKISFTLPTYIQELIKMIQMTTEIENNLKGKRNKKYPTNNDTQWERILVIENIPQYTSEKQLRQKIKAILTKNNGKILSPTFDIFYESGQLVILVDSWDITELVEEDVMQKIENEEQKEPEPENGDQGLLMQWSCQVCTFLNQAGVPTCGICDAAAPAPKAQIVYEKIQSKDVNETELKLRQKQMKRFENIKQEIKAYITESWKSQCARIDSLKQKEQKLKQQRKKKKGKNVETEQKVFQKPAQPQILLSSGSTVLDKKIVEQFLRKRYEKLPELITKKVNGEQFNTYLSKFKELTKLGYDLWGDNIANEAPTLLSFEYLSELMQYVQDQICKGSSSVLSYNQASIRMINQIPLLRDDQEQPLNFNTENNIGVKAKYKRLAEQKSYNIRYSWKVIKELNLSASKCLPFINMQLISNEEGKAICSINTIGSNLKCLRQLIMGALKLQLFQKIMQRTSVVLDAQDIPKINLERLKVKDETGRNAKLISSKDKDDFLFTKSQEQLQKVSSINLRPFKPKGTEPYLSFIVNFKGEMVQGQAGPYRQFFTDISNELAPESGLNLFIKTPNNAHKTGEGRSKWTINPKANSTYCLSLFFFLGRLMGCCIRTGCHMPIDLANFCWKLIADQKVKESDIDELDRQFNEQNKQLIQCPSESTFDYMQEAVGQPVSWVYTTIDGQEQDLIPNGKSERVSYQDRIRYVEMMERRRIEEISLQVQKIRDGLNQMVSEPFLNHVSGDELKTIICGVPKVDVELLKKHTKYAGGLNEESPVIKYFWEMMKEISEQQRLKVIRFCWGQERLPLNSQEFERNGVRFMIKPMLNKQNPDQALPKADTCFFNIELPQYSTKQIMKQRILLAVNLDNVSINGDRNIQPDDNPLMGNVDYEDDGEQEEDEEGGGGGG